MNTQPEAILIHALSLPEGGMVSPKEFCTWAPGRLRWRKWWKPWQPRTVKWSPPHGAIAVNSLGLTQQVPIREVYLTSRRTRKLKLGRSEIVVKHVPHWMLALGTAPADAQYAPWPGMPASRWRRCTALFRRQNGESLNPPRRRSRRGSRERLARKQRMSEAFIRLSQDGQRTSGEFSSVWPKSTGCHRLQDIHGLNRRDGKAAAPGSCPSQPHS